jgi:sulfur carrier protein ThiS
MDLSLLSLETVARMYADYEEFGAEEEQRKILDQLRSVGIDTDQFVAAVQPYLDTEAVPDHAWLEGHREIK